MLGTVLAVAVGSAVGAPTRYVLDRLVSSRHERLFPWGTFTVNISGSFLLGLLVSAGAHGGVEPWLLAALGTGFLGAYTTFSTYTWESMRLVEDGAVLVACLNLGGSVVAGAVAAAAGLAVGGL
jgi:fluoride exporter